MRSYDFALLDSVKEAERLNSIKVSREESKRLKLAVRRLNLLLFGGAR